MCLLWKDENIVKRGREWAIKFFNPVDNLNYPFSSLPLLITVWSNPTALLCLALLAINSTWSGRFGGHKIPKISRELFAQVFCEYKKLFFTKTFSPFSSFLGTLVLSNDGTFA